MLNYIDYFVDLTILYISKGIFIALCFFICILFLKSMVSFIKYINNNKIDVSKYAIGSTYKFIKNRMNENKRYENWISGNLSEVDLKELDDEELTLFANEVLSLNHSNFSLRCHSSYPIKEDDIYLTLTHMKLCNIKNSYLISPHGLNSNIEDMCSNIDKNFNINFLSTKDLVLMYNLSH